MTQLIKAAVADIAKGYQTKKERQEEIATLGKAIVRAGFKCEWCGSKEDLRIWDYKPDVSPKNFRITTCSSERRIKFF
jgi:hypothetical protein